MDPKFKVIISLIFPSILFIAAAIPLVLQKVPPNGLYGFRLRKTFSDKDIWYKANRFGGIAVLASGAVSLIGCLILFLHKEALSFWTIKDIGLGLLVVPVAVAIGMTLLYIRKL